MASAATNLIAVAPTPLPEDTRELLVALTRKVDALNLQVGHLYERTVAAEELKEDLVHIARDAVSALQVELSAMEHEFNAEEIVHLLRQMLRSTPRFVRVLEHLESLDSLLQEMGPLGKDMLRALVERLQEWEERGYFQLVQDLVGFLDRMAEHSKEGDLKRLLEVADGALATVAGGDGDAAKPVGLWGLARATRDPAVRRGLGVLVELLRHLGGQSTAEPRALPAEQTEQRLLTGAKE